MKTTKIPEDVTKPKGMPHPAIALSYRKKAMLEKEEVNEEEIKERIEELKRFIKEAKESKDKFICFEVEGSEYKDIVLNMMLDNGKYTCTQNDAVGTANGIWHVLTFAKTEYKDRFNHN